MDQCTYLPPHSDYSHVTCTVLKALVIAAKPVEVASSLDGTNVLTLGDSGEVQAADQSPRIKSRGLATSGGGNVAFSNPPPLLPGAANSSRGGTRIRRSILGTVVAAVQRRGAGSTMETPSWVSAATPGSPGPTVGGNSRDRGFSIGSTGSVTGAAARPEDLEIKTSLNTCDAELTFGGRTDRLVRTEILIGSVVVVIAGGYSSGLYGVIAASFLCILTIMIAFVPLAL